MQFFAPYFQNPPLKRTNFSYCASKGQQKCPYISTNAMFSKNKRDVFSNASGLEDKPAKVQLILKTAVLQPFGWKQYQNGKKRHFLLFFGWGTTDIVMRCTFFGRGCSLDAALQKYVGFFEHSSNGPSTLVLLIQLDWTPNTSRQKVNSEKKNCKGYDNHETAIGKLLARRIQIRSDYFCKIHFWPLIFLNMWKVPRFVLTRINF